MTAAENSPRRAGRPRTAPGTSEASSGGSASRRPQRPFYAAGLLCPVDPAHGRLIDWPTDRWAFYCPDQAHDGHGDVPQSRPFFTTTEAESGLPAPRSAQAAPALLAEGRDPLAQDPGLIPTPAIPFADVDDPYTATPRAVALTVGTGQLGLGFAPG